MVRWPTSSSGACFCITAGMPMRAKSTLQGAPSPAEDLKSVKKALTKYVDSKSCVGTTDSDSAPALLHGFAQRGMPVVGARHYLDEMTPFRAIKKKGLTKQQERTLKKAQLALTNSKKASLEQKTQYKVVAGDNQAESLISGVKLQLRRSNRVGRGSPKLAHVECRPASSFTNVENAPGLSNLLAAFANYRKARCNQMGCSPKDFLNLNTDEKWLWE